MNSFLQKNYLYLILLLFLIYSFVQIRHSSFLINNVRYYSLFDDEMISMRYAKNLANGHGLVWNPGGDRVEGITNPLWTVYMTFFHLFHLAESKISLFIQLSCVLLSAVNLILIKKISEKIVNNRIIITSILFLSGFYYPITTWNILGTEVPLLTVLLSSAILTMMNTKDKKRNLLLPFILLAISTLVRLDAIVPSLAMIMYIFINYRKTSLKTVGIGFSIFLLTIIVQILLRSYYYHDIFPNTYYLKMTGFPLLFRISRGLVVVSQFLLSINWLIAIGVLSIAFIKKNKILVLFASLFLIQLLYSVYVGGDVWEYFGGSNRFITPVIPLYFILIGYSLSLIQSFSKKRFHLIKPLLNYPPLLMAMYLFTLNFANSGMLFESTLLKIPQTMPGNKYNTERALFLDSITDSNAKIAVAWAGTTPYFSKRTYIDLLGKSDKRIAHEPARFEAPMSFWMKLTAFFPGHMKWDYAYSIGELKPDIIAEISLPSEADPFIRNYKKISLNEHTFYVNTESKHVHLENIKK